MSRLIDSLRQHRYLVLLLVSGLLAPLITEIGAAWLQETLGQTSARLIQILAVLVALTVGLWVLALALRTKPEPVVLVARDAQPPRCRGLIALVGPGRPDDDPMKQAAVRAIEYHLDEGALQFCWLIASSGERGSVPVAERICQDYEDRCQIFVRPVGDAFSVQDTYNVVQRIYEQELSTPGERLDGSLTERGYLIQLRGILATRFNKSELRVLCFNLGIEYENLPGETLEDKATGLADYCNRHAEVLQLAKVVKKLRPDVQWKVEEAEKDPVTPSDPPKGTPETSHSLVLLPEEVIADFTGGTRPMSAGMVLACGKSRPMQYMTGYKPWLAFHHPITAEAQRPTQGQHGVRHAA